MKPFRPMLAKPADFSILRFPLYASVKIDGLRCTVRDGKPMSRSGEVLPNRHFQRWVADYAYLLNGLDGEVVVGPVNAPDVYRASASGIMSHDGEPRFTFHVFDTIHLEDPYQVRYQYLWDHLDRSPIRRTHLVLQHLIDDHDELNEFEAEALADGHEGIMTRDPAGYYKQGRATARTQELLKIKRFLDGEAVVIGVEEEMHNTNEATTSAIGKTKRSSHQENLVGKGTLGALIVRGVTAYKNVEFKIGTGFDAALRDELWRDRKLLGKIVKFKYFPVGAKDKPRHPVFLGFRDPKDL